MRNSVVLVVLSMIVALPSWAQDYSLELSANLQSRVAEYLSPELRTQVEQLKRDVIAEPTNKGNVFSRVDVFWKWANAFALTGRPIHPELPSMVARIARSEAMGKGNNRLFGVYLDRFIKELSFRDANPGAIGELSTDKLGPYPVDSHVSIRQSYTVGDAPIKQGGGILVTPRYHGGVSGFQWQDPEGEGYVSASTSNPDVELDVMEIGVTGMFSGRLGSVPVNKPFFRILKGELQPGDKITITIGDQSHGGAGYKISSASNDAMRFKLWVAFENPDDYLVLAELPFYSVGGETASVRGFAASIVAQGEAITLSVRSGDDFRNRATSGFPVYEIYDGGNLIATAGNTDLAIQQIKNIRFDNPGVHYLTIRSRDGRFTGEFNPILVEKNPVERIYWGETHGHSGFAEGSGTVNGFFEFARDDAQLDYMTLSEHDLWMDDSEWEVLREAVIRLNDPGQFITFLGYEWTVHNVAGGHHNVLFRTPENRQRVSNQEAPTLPQLYPLLKARHDENDVIVIPHAHNPGQWWLSDPATERLVEIVSNHGTFEWLGRAYLSNGYKLGFIGGSDDHIGHPGLRPLNKSGYGSDNFGGLAAVMAVEKSRDAIFDALRDKHTYATNGKRIILKTSVNGAAGGRSTKPEAVQLIKGRVIGTSPIDSVVLIKNGEELERIDYLQNADDKQDLLELRFFSESDPYKRDVKSRGWRVWHGTLKVSNAEINGVATPNVENVYRESARISASDPNTVEFYIRTRGAAKSIQIGLKGVNKNTRLELDTTAGKKARFSHVFDYTSLDNPSGETVESRAGAHVDRLQARFVDLPTERERQFEFKDASPTKEGDSYFVRVIEQGGGMAWSSPVWIEAAK